MTRNLEGHAALITGAAGGIGLGIARALAGVGMKLALADVDTQQLEQTAEDMRAEGIEVLPLRLDVRDRAAWESAAEAVKSRFGGVHVLCNNAGVTNYDPLTEMPPENWDWIVGVNLTGVFNGIRAIVPDMIKAGGGGHVLNTASGAGLFPMKGYSIGAYAATKAAVIAMSEALRLELAPHGIGVSALCPGLVDTRIGTMSAAFRPMPSVRPRPQHLAKTVNRGGADPLWVGEQALAGILADQPYIFTRDEADDFFREPFEERVSEIRRCSDNLPPPRVL